MKISSNIIFYKEINKSKQVLLKYLLSGVSVYYSNYPLQLRNKHTKEVYSRWIRVFTDEAKDSSDETLLLTSLEMVFELSVDTPNCDGVVFDNKAFLKQEVIENVLNEFRYIETERKESSHDNGIKLYDVETDKKKK